MFQTFRGLLYHWHDVWSACGRFGTALQPDYRLFELLPPGEGTQRQFARCVFRGSCSFSRIYGEPDGFAGEAGKNATLRFKIGSEVAKLKEQYDQEGEEGGHGHGHGSQAEGHAVSSIPLPAFDSPSYKTEPYEHSIELVEPAIEALDINKKISPLGTFTPGQGGNFLYIIKKISADNYTISEHIITQPNSIHMLWLVPQYVVITVAEIMFSVTGLQFAFSQAPASMKSVLQACWLLTVAFGNVIVIFLAEFKPFNEQYKEFFLYSGLMFVDMVIFAVLAYFYVPQEEVDSKKDDPPMEMKENKAYDDYDP